MTPDTETPDRAFRLTLEYNLSALETKLFLRLWQGPASLGDLADAMYANREDGGPLCALECARQIFYRLRRKLGDRATVHTKHLFELELHPGRR